MCLTFFRLQNKVYSNLNINSDFLIYPNTNLSTDVFKTRNLFFTPQLLAQQSYVVLLHGLFFNQREVRKKVSNKKHSGTRSKAVLDTSPALAKGCFRDAQYQVSYHIIMDP